METPQRQIVSEFWSTRSNSYQRIWSVHLNFQKQKGIYHWLEKNRPIYEEQAKRNQSLAGGDKKSPLSTLTKAITNEESINVREKLAEKANVGAKTYSKGKKIAFGEFDKPITNQKRRKQSWKKSKKSQYRN